MVGYKRVSSGTINGLYILFHRKRLFCKCNRPGLGNAAVSWENSRLVAHISKYLRLVPSRVRSITGSNAASAS